MNIKYYRCPDNNTLEVVVKEKAQGEYEITLYKVYGDKDDDDGETYDEYATAVTKTDKAPETFDEAVLLILNDIGLVIDHLRWELRKEKNKCYRCDYYKNDLPF